MSFSYNNVDEKKKNRFPGGATVCVGVHSPHVCAASLWCSGSSRVPRGNSGGSPTCLPVLVSVSVGCVEWPCDGRASCRGAGGWSLEVYGVFI